MNELCPSFMKSYCLSLPKHLLCRINTGSFQETPSGGINSHLPFPRLCAVAAYAKTFTLTQYFYQLFRFPCILEDCREKKIHIIPCKLSHFHKLFRKSYHLFASTSMSSCLLRIARGHEELAFHIMHITTKELLPDSCHWILPTCTYINQLALWLKMDILSLTLATICLFDTYSNTNS